MFVVGSTSGLCKALLLKEPEPVLINAPEEDKDREEDNNKDVLIKDLINITITYLAKVNTLPKFRGEVGKLIEFITKLQIYYKYNLNSFALEANKVTYTILYTKGIAFDFIETFLFNFIKEKNRIKKTNIIFSNVNYFFKILKVI